MAVWQSAEFDDHEQICYFTDPGSALKAIVAIHSTALGPAVGGTRFWPYADDRSALDDALRLSRAMSYKAAMASLPFGGGKAIISGDPERLKDERLLHAYGRFLNRIGTVFATGEDVGMTIADCEVIRQVSPYVGGTSTAGAGDPSIHTAKGIMHGLRAVSQFRFARENVGGLHIAVQGLGNVGWRLCELLHRAGARLTVADIKADRAANAGAKFDARVVSHQVIHTVDADIFAPCAMGGVVSLANVEDIRANAIAGAANNQLADAASGEALQHRGILYAPDFVINAGGVISGVEEIANVPGRKGIASEPLETRLERIHDRLLALFNRAAAEHKTPEATAVRMAKEIISR
jgi:leucine dehydrogenase